MLYYYSGKETYLKKQELRKIKKSVDNPDLNWADFYEFTPEIYEFLDSFSFVNEKKYCILHFFPEYEDFLEHLGGNADVYIVTADIPDGRKKATKQILSAAKKKEFGKIGEDLLMKCIFSRFQKFGYRNEEIASAQEELKKAFQVYFLDPEMDLEEVQKHVELIALSGTLSKDTIQAFAPESANLKAYKLSTMILDQDSDSLVFAEQLLEQGEQPISILSLVIYQIRICYKAVLYKEEKYLSLIGIREFQLYPGFSKYSAATYREAHQILISGINRIKKGESQRSVFLESIIKTINLLSK